MPSRQMISILVAAASIGLLGACTSNPSNKAVVNDAIQSITVPGGSTLPQAQQDCMLEYVDGLSSGELEQLGEANVDESITLESHGTEAMQEFIDQLEQCGSGSSTAGTEPTTPTTEG
jgi:hypothetical protein